MGYSAPYDHDDNPYTPNVKDSNLTGKTKYDKQYASKTMANVLRAQHEDYKTRYRPLEMEIVDRVMNPAYMADTQQDALKSVQTGFANAERQFQQRMTGLGVQATPEQIASHGRTMNIGRGLAEVEAVNRLTQQTKDRNLGVVGGGFSPRSYIKEAMAGGG